MQTLVKRTGMYVLLAIGAYLMVGNLLHRFIFPEKKPEVSTFFKPGQEFYSEKEGFRQRVVKQEGGKVYCTLEAEPFAAGPPKHVHSDFDETFEIENGEMTLWIDGEIKKLRPGQVIHIPKGTPHKPYNETAEIIRSKDTFAFPEKFAFHLVQTYGYMDSHPNFIKEPKTIFQIALLQQAGFDSYIVEGPPVLLQKAIGFVANPISRLLGLKSYYKEYNVLKDKPALAKTGDK